MPPQRRGRPERLRRALGRCRPVDRQARGRPVATSVLVAPTVTGMGAVARSASCVDKVWRACSTDMPPTSTPATVVSDATSEPETAHTVAA